MATRTSNVGNFNTGDVLTEAHVDSLPAGWLGYVEKTADQTTISSEVDVSSLTVTVTVNANRRLYLVAFVNAGGTVVDNRIAVWIKEGATQLQGAVASVPIADASLTTMSFSPSAVITPSAGVHTYKITAGRITGAGTFNIQASSTSPCYLLVRDVGPAS